MDLEELKKRLYKKDNGIEDRPQPPTEFTPGTKPSVPLEPIPQWNEPLPGKISFSVGRKRIFWTAGILLVLGIIALTGYLIWRSQHSFDNSQVALEIFGQERIVSGEDAAYIVRYKNNTKVALKNASLIFTFSQGSIPSDKENLETRGGFPVIKKTLGDIEPNQEEQIEFKARVLGDKDSQQNFLARLEYQPANVSSSFANEANFASTIISVPLILNFDLPERLVSGQTLNFSLGYLNTSDAVFSDSKIEITWPAGFKLESTLPSPSNEEKTAWLLPEIGSHEEGKIMIKGTIQGNENETEVFSARIGMEKDNEFIVYAQTLSSPQISVAPLFVEQSSNLKENLANGNLTADPGQSINYKLKYINTTDVTIGPVVVTLKIDSKVVDPASVTATNGFFNSSDSTIIWNAALLPSLNSLAAKAEGELKFSLKIKDKLPVNNFSDKNFTVVTTAKMDSPNVPLSLTGTQLAGTNQLAIKINSRLVLSTKGYYTDKLIPNSGPLPPRVGQKTTYTIYWQILNVSNNLSEVSVEAYLPSYVQWENNIYPKNENITYESATGKVIWRINNLAAATGILTPVKQIAFQVGLVPSIGQIGSWVTIVKDAKISGIDTFTQTPLQATVNNLQSNMPDDPTVGQEKGKITQCPTCQTSLNYLLSLR